MTNIIYIKVFIKNDENIKEHKTYEFNLDSKIKDIINKISSTMVESTNINTTFDYSNFIKLSNNKSVASIIVISFQKKGIILNNQNLIFKDINIGEVK